MEWHCSRVSNGKNRENLSKVVENEGKVGKSEVDRKDDMLQWKCYVGITAARV